MTHKEAVVALLEQMPDNLICEVRHYAEFLYAKLQHAQWVGYRPGPSCSALWGR